MSRKNKQTEPSLIIERDVKQTATNFLNAGLSPFDAEQALRNEGYSPSDIFAHSVLVQLMHFRRPKVTRRKTYINHHTNKPSFKPDYGTKEVYKRPFVVED